MTALRLLGVAGLALGLAVGTSTAEAARIRATHVVHGTVVDVHQPNGKDAASVTLKTHHKKKGTTVTQVVDRRFKVTSTTRVEIVRGKKGAQEHLPGTFADVHDGEHVVLSVRGDIAELISIHKGHKK